MDSGSTVFGSVGKIIDIQGYLLAHLLGQFCKPCQTVWQKEVRDLTAQHYGKAFKAVASVSHVSFYPAYGGVVHRWIASGSKIPERVSRLFSQFPDSFSRQFHDYHPIVFEFLKPTLCRFYKHNKSFITSDYRDLYPLREEKAHRSNPMNHAATNKLEASNDESGTVLQYHLKNKTIRPRVIQDALRLSRSTVHKWALGELFPHRPNAVQLIEVFGEHGIELDYNDIYQIEKAS